ncbi:MAG: hypothetical protein MUO21_08030, partial [Nitrososphaeraceae archaeon]|nr:hypothetical protein [Nitrososphaeraceae archaeon]
METAIALPSNIKDILENFVCPITLHIVRNPVIASDGKIYEESAFIELLTKDNKSPITRENLNKKYYSSHDIKSTIDHLENLYPEIKSLRYIEDMTYVNNISKIQRFVKQDNMKKIMDYTDFVIKDMIRKNILDKVIEKSAFDVLDHIIEYSLDLDKDLLIFIICSSMKSKNSTNFAIDYLQKYAPLFDNDNIVMGIFFNHSCFYGD